MKGIFLQRRQIIILSEQDCVPRASRGYDVFAYLELTNNVDLPPQRAQIVQSCLSLSCAYFGLELEEHHVSDHLVRLPFFSALGLLFHSRRCRSRISS